MDCTEQEPAGSARLPTAGTHAGWSALYSVARTLPPLHSRAGLLQVVNRSTAAAFDHRIPARALSTTTHR